MYPYKRTSVTYVLESLDFAPSLQACNRYRHYFIEILIFSDIFNHMNIGGCREGLISEKSVFEASSLFEV